MHSVPATGHRRVAEPPSRTHRIGGPQAPDRHGKHNVQDGGTHTRATRHRHAVSAANRGQFFPH